MFGQWSKVMLTGTLPDDGSIEILPWLRTSLLPSAKPNWKFEGDPETLHFDSTSSAQTQSRHE